MSTNGICDESFVEIISMGVPQDKEAAKLRKLLKPHVYADLIKILAQNNHGSRKRKVSLRNMYGRR